MSSPHTLQSPAAHPLELNTADPYLSAPSDPEESEFQASAIRLTPVGGSPGHSASSPHDGTAASVSGYSAHGQDYLSPQNNNSNNNTSSHYIDPSASLSPNNTGGFLAPSDIDLASGIGEWSNAGTMASFGTTGTPTTSTHSNWPPLMGMNNSYLNPENTIPSPASATEHSAAQNHIPMAIGGPFVSPTQPGLGISNQPYGQPRLSISSEHDARQNNTIPAVPAVTRGRSPTVTVEYIPRGDSPTQEEPSRYERRASRSSVHLSVSGLGDQSSEEGDNYDDQKSISSNPVERSKSGHWLPNPSTGLGGLDPSSRGNDYVPSPNDLKGERERERKIEDIMGWTESVSRAGSEAGDDPAPRPHRRHAANNRLRARSTGDRPLQQEDYFNLKFGPTGQAIPGPRLVLHESSEDEFSETSESTAEADEPGRYDRSTPEVYSSLEQQSPEDGEARLYPWNDYPQGPIRTEAMQPGSSTAAMVAFEKRARDLETASLTATIDNNSIINFGANFERMSISDAPKKPEKRNSLLKRSYQQASNMLKRQASDLSLATVNSHQATPEPQRKDSGSHRHRLSLSTKQNRHSRSPSLSNALLSMSGQLAAVGGSHSVQAVSPNAEPSAGRNSLQGRSSLQIKARGRSRSEVPRPPTPGLIDLMTTHGGPPVASITRYQQQESGAAPSSSNAVLDPEMAGGDDEDEVDLADDKGLVMQFPPITRLPVPTFEGFKAQIMQLSPGLEPALIHRFALAQVQRYKTLVELQQKHSAAVANRSCKSGRFCIALGGQPVLLQQQKALADTEAGQTQFRITDYSQGVDQPYGANEGAIAAAQFPPGVPLPPVSRLPAQFECPICFQVKKFQKPSDWTKHVHEDVQPFTCSFPECMEPKSFKRKADWVRHESERHRQLEWWTCSYPDCSHVCYRKNNFVQHLVREHKVPEPRMKKTKGSTTAEGSAANQREQEFWQMVASCRNEPEQTPSKEPCRFCGNVCTAWKKLTVHLGKHMEQLAMPVLELAKQSSTPSQFPMVSGSESHASSSLAAPTLAPASASATAAAAAPVPFQSNHNNHAENPSASAQLARQQYSTNEAEPASQPFYYTDMPMTNYSSISGTQLSMEPESIDLAADQFPSYGGMGQYHDHSHDSHGHGHDQATLHPPQTHPLHQHQHQNSTGNVSSTYPPPYNAVPRPRTPETNPTLLPNSYSLSSQLPPQHAHAHAHAHAPPQVEHPPSIYPGQHDQGHASGYATYQPVAPNPNGSYTSAYTSSYSSQM